MKGKTDICRKEGEEFFSVYLIDKYRPFYNKTFDVFLIY